MINIWLLAGTKCEVPVYVCALSFLPLICLSIKHNKAAVHVGPFVSC